MGSEEVVTIARQRVQRVVDVLSLLSLDEFDLAAEKLVTDESQDAFSFLEESLSVFIRELALTRRENTEHIERLQEKTRDVESTLATVREQQAAIAELSTPIIEVWDQIITLPIVGNVDARRSVEMTEHLLQRVADGHFRCVIIDVTGVSMIDSMTADHFIKMIQSSRLLGAYCVVTGMSPSVSQTLVSLGVDMSGFRTLRNLKVGLEHCIQHLQQTDRAGRGDDSRKAGT
jgi:rsbT co-antagonist protein RsbR